MFCALLSFRTDSSFHLKPFSSAMHTTMHHHIDYHDCWYGHDSSSHVLDWKNRQQKLLSGTEEVFFYRLKNTYPANWLEFRVIKRETDITWGCVVHMAVKRHFCHYYQLVDLIWGNLLYNYEFLASVDKRWKNSTHRRRYGFSIWWSAAWWLFWGLSELFFRSCRQCHFYSSRPGVLRAHPRVFIIGFIAIRFLAPRSSSGRSKASYHLLSNSSRLAEWLSAFVLLWSLPNRFFGWLWRLFSYWCWFQFIF